MPDSPDAPPVGRNDPCPCGSGKKYKKCCLGGGPGGGPEAAPFTQADRDRAVEKLMRFSELPRFRNDHGIAMALFWAGFSDEEVERALDVAEREIEIFYHSWFVFDFDIEDGRTLVDFFLDERVADLAPAERAFLRDVRDTHLALYEVEEVRPERGLRLRDLWTGERFEVRERAATRTLHRGAPVAARLHEWEPGAWRIEGGIYGYLSDSREAILETLRDFHADFEAGSTTAGRAAFFKRIGFVFHHLWMIHVGRLADSVPTLGTPEGDPMRFVEARFEVPDPDGLERALAEHPEIEASGDAEWVWLESGGPGDDFRRILGTLRREGDRLILESISEPRAARGRALVEEIAGDAVRHLVTAVEDAREALERTPQGEPGRGGRPAGEEPVLPDAEMERLAHQVLDRHYRTWPDTALPALDGLTPREAAADPEMRPRVIELLESLGAHPGGGALPGGTYDYGWLWEELGLERR